MTRVRISRPSSRRGFTVTELLISSALVALLVGGLLSWLTGLVDVSAVHADLTGPRLSARYAAEQLRSDVTAARPCQPAGLGAPLHQLTASTLAVYADADLDGDVDVVWWRYDNPSQQLQRTVETGTGTCSFGAAPPAGGWTVVAADVTAATFAGIGGRDPSYTGGCTGTDAESCLFAAVALSATVTVGPSAATAAVDTTVPLDTSGSFL